MSGHEGARICVPLEHVVGGAPLRTETPSKSLRRHSWDADHLVCLYRQTPLRACHAVLRRLLSIFGEVRPIHGLKEEILKVKSLKVGRRQRGLRVDNLKFVTLPDHEIGSRLRAHTDPCQSL